MKNVLFLAITVLAMTVTAAPMSKVKPQKSAAEKACEKIENTYWNLCAHALCDDEVASGSFESFDECAGASDAGEAIQASCEGLDETLDSLLADYNKANNASLQCAW